MKYDNPVNALCYWKVPWTEHNRNEDILQMVETEREIMDKC